MADNKQDDNKRGELVPVGNSPHFIKVRNILNSGGHILPPLEYFLVVSTIYAAQLKNGDIDQRAYYVKAKNLVENFNQSPANIYRDLKSAAESLLKRTIKLSYEDALTLGLENIDQLFPAGKKAGYVEAHWVATCHYIPDEGSVGVRFAEEFIPLINAVKREFTLYDPTDLRGIKSRYALRLYPMLLQFKKTGLMKISVAEFRERLLLNDKKSFQAFGNLKQRIIDPALAELNASPYTKYSFSMEAKKEGRVYTQLIFYIDPKAKLLKAEDQPTLLPKEGEVIKTIKVASYKLSKDQIIMAAEWLLGYNEKTKQTFKAATGRSYVRSEFFNFLIDNKIADDSILIKSAYESERRDLLCKLLADQTVVRKVYTTYLRPMGLVLKNISVSDINDSLFPDEEAANYVNTALAENKRQQSEVDDLDEFLVHTSSKPLHERVIQDVVGYLVKGGNKNYEINMNKPYSRAEFFDYLYKRDLIKPHSLDHLSDEKLTAVLTKCLQNESFKNAINYDWIEVFYPRNK